MRSAVVRGDGVAAHTVAVLLGAAGYAVEVRPVDRPRVPVVLLSESAVALLTDVLGAPGLFAERPRIRRRIVAWGGQPPLEMEHAAVAVSESELLAALPAPAASVVAQPDWELFAGRPLPAGARDHRFGDRQATASAVQLAASADQAACYMEALPDGWLFLVPAGGESAWLLAVGAAPEVLLGASRLIAPRLAGRDAASAPFATAPRIVAPLAGEGWLACGTAAIAFDPICGDGTAHAVREAILAAAVVRAIDGGGDRASLLRHYEARLGAGFARHLALSLNLYRSGADAPWWREQAAGLEAGLEWCREHLPDGPGRGYRLEGFDLVPLPA